MATPVIQERCIACGKTADPRGATEAYCIHTCTWPNGGCGERIFFRVNLNQKVQPFDLKDGKPHHASCKAYNASRICPSCSRPRRKNGSCKHCGWQPGQNPRDFPGHVHVHVQGGSGPLDHDWQ